MSDRKTAELVVIGAGPAGYPAAFRAADMGMQVTLIDPEVNPGGVCLYRGCIPSKVLLHVVKLKEELALAADWGLHADNARVEPGELRAWKDKVIKQLTGGLGRIVKQRGITYVQGLARFSDERTLTVVPADGDEYALSFDHAIVATGSAPASIPSAIQSPRVMTSRQALDIDDVPDRLLVIGGGYIGLELGQVYASLGSRVNVVEMLPEILPGGDRDLVKFLERRLKKQFESIRVSTKVTGMKEQKNGINVQMEGDNAPGKDQLFDKVMLAVGRKPWTESIDLGKANIEVTEKGFVDVDEQRRTSNRHVFAIGDVAGEPMLAHKGTHEAPVAVEAIAGKNSAFEPRAIPFVVFSDPELAWCGLTEPDAKKEGRAVDVSSFPWKASGRALTLGRTDGVTKLLTDPETQQVLGVGFAGRDAGELIGQGISALEMGANAEDLALMVQTHPTLSETLMEAAEAAVGQSTHYFKKKH
ncbi:MAG: dihydrolipoyl dehydrogenase [Kiritimatiellales bacterium]|nr:dihydrolipoyl dehydrogenase [Kiritimatiellales bacterium]